jgi:hypothetical protein
MLSDLHFLDYTNVSFQSRVIFRRFFYRQRESFNFIGSPQTFAFKTSMNFTFRLSINLQTLKIISHVDQGREEIAIQKLLISESFFHCFFPRDQSSERMSILFSVVSVLVVESLNRRKKVRKQLSTLKQMNKSV